MGYVSETVQAAISLADRQVGQYVEKARGYERIDALIDLASQGTPAVVKQLDEKVDQVLGGVYDGKAKVFERYSGVVELVQQTKGGAVDRFNETKGDALDRYNGAKDFVEQKKGDAFEFVQRNAGATLERVQQSKDGMFEFVQEKKGSVQSLAQERLPEGAQERLSQLQVQVGLLMTVLVAQYHSVLDFPQSLKQRMEKGLPELLQQYSASVETVKSWATEQFEKLPQLGGVAKQLRLATLEKLLEKGEAAAFFEQLPVYRARATEAARDAMTQLPAYRARATEAARDAMAWVKARAPTKQA